MDRDNSRPIIYGGVLYSKDEGGTNKNGGLCILKADLDNVNTRTMEEGKWVDFVEDWHTDIDYMEWHMDIWEDFRNNHNGPEWPNHEEGFSSTIQFFTPNAWKIQHKIKLENSIKFFHEFIVAQNGPIYGYKLVAERYI